MGEELTLFFKVKGVGVAPAELEDTLHGHAAVKDVTVIGVRDQSSGEILKALVVLQPGVPRNSTTAAELVEYIKSKVSRPKWIDGGVEFINEIPKSPSGKILRRVLKNQLKKLEEGQRKALRL
jgi:4-coumarate--CoA ligase